MRIAVIFTDLIHVCAFLPGGQKKVEKIIIVLGKISRCPGKALLREAKQFHGPLDKVRGGRKGGAGNAQKQTVVAKGKQNGIYILGIYFQGGMVGSRLVKAWPAIAHGLDLQYVRRGKQPSVLRADIKEHAL